MKKCGACQKKFTPKYHVNSKYCRKCSNNLRNFSGRDHAREIIRIKFKRTCQDCRRKWKKGERRFDVHHLKGLCGKKSKGFDSVKDAKRLFTLLCHSCHLGKHVSKERFLNRALKDVSISKIEDLHWQGLSYEKIGKIYGCSGTAIIHKINAHKNGR